MTIHDKIAKHRMGKGVSTDDRGLLALIQSEICIDGKPMEDDMAVIRLTQMVKTCDKNIVLYKETENFDKAVEEAVFRGMLMTYLPTPANQEDIEMALAILDLPRTMKSMGPVMKHLKEIFQVVDGNLVKSILMGE